MNPYTISVDFSKDYIDLYRLLDSKRFRITNHWIGFKAFANGLA
ncbi:hypothetical protein ACFOVS_13795 [Rhizobium lemnae]|uniref:IS110 family transposase n=1 Tax=Rhizobium lemnae TaxID=1214924 RepID=A0ABV8ECJ9_9HYPH|nr:hypothetical protein [Rhizobium lemnae]